MTFLETMMNADSLADAKRGKVMYLDLDEIVPNELNYVEVNDIESLAENIEEGGLIEPLAVLVKDGKTVLHSGHRRLAALKLLRDQGKAVRFMGKEIMGEAPVLYLPQMDELEEKVSMVRSNSYRHLDKDERRKVMLHCHALYQELAESGAKPAGREREWITATTGISDGTVKEFLADFNRQAEVLNAPDLTEEEKPAKEKDPIEECKKKAKAFNKYMTNVDLSGMLPSDKEDIKEILDDLMETLNTVLYQ